MLQLAPNYDGLPVLNKLEAFEHALQKTDGQDVAKVLWLRSLNAEHWLTRRTNYTRSLAVMSMVGYILGLGDRHPSNLMLDRLTGKILHIDFGDCFEVAMRRGIRSCARLEPTSCHSALSTRGRWRCTARSSRRRSRSGSRGCSSRRWRCRSRVVDPVERSSSRRGSRY